MLAEVVLHERTERAALIGHTFVIEEFVCGKRDNAPRFVAPAVLDAPKSQREVGSNDALNHEPTLVGKGFDAIAIG